MVLCNDHDSVDVPAELLSVCFPKAIVNVACTGEGAVALGSKTPHSCHLRSRGDRLGGEDAAQVLRLAYRVQPTTPIAHFGNVVGLATLKTIGPFGDFFSGPVHFDPLIEVQRRHGRSS